MIKSSKLFISLFSMGLLLSTCVPASTLKYGYAQTFNFFTPFSTHEVNDFNGINQVFNSYTIGSSNFVSMGVSFDYFMSAEPTSSFPMELEIRVSNSGASQTILDIKQFNIPSSLTKTSASFGFDFNINDYPNIDFIFSNVIDDNALFSRLVPRLNLVNTPIWSGVTFTIENIRFNVGYQILYDAIYLFNVFLNDIRFNGFSATGYTNLGSNVPTLKVNYIYSNTINTNTNYNIFNQDDFSIALGRKKYAITIPNQMFIGNIIGVEFESRIIGNGFSRVIAGTGKSRMDYTYDLFYLNGGDISAPISPVPSFQLNYEDCGGFFSLNVPCFLNNALAWLVNDAPLISDAIGVINSGIVFIGQGIGFMGAFVSSTNIITWLIVGGFGIILIKWVASNDE